MTWGSLCWRCVLYGTVVVSSLIGPALITRYFDREPTVQIDAITAAEDVSIAAGRINIRSHFDKFRNCDTDVGRFLYRVEDHDGQPERVIVPLTPTITSLTGVGPDQHVVISLDVPLRLSPGRWFYYSIAEVKCGIFSLTQFRRTPDIPVELYAVD